MPQINVTLWWTFFYYSEWMARKTNEKLHPYICWKQIWNANYIHLRYLTLIESTYIIAISLRGRSSCQFWTLFNWSCFSNESFRTRFNIYVNALFFIVCFCSLKKIYSVFAKHPTNTARHTSLIYVHIYEVKNIKCKQIKKVFLLNPTNVKPKVNNRTQIFDSHWFMCSVDAQQKVLLKSKTIFYLRRSY